MTGDCAAETCPVEGGYVSYEPSIGGNAFLLAAFATLMPLAFIFGWRARTKGFTITTMMGLLLEVLGFVGRLLMNGGRARQSNFALYLIGTTLGSTLFAAGLFTVLPHVLAVYGESACVFRSAHVLMLLSSLAVLVVVLEIVGVVFAVFGKSGSVVDHSTNVLVAGLAVQIGALILFMGIHFSFTLGLRNMKVDLDSTHANVYRSSKFKRFLIIMQLAVACLLISTIFRAVEIAGGLDGPLAQSEAAVMIMVGGIPLLAMILLTIFHPGMAFGKAWRETTPQYLHTRETQNEVNPPVGVAPYEPTFVTLPVQELGSSANPGRYKFRPVAPRPLEGLKPVGTPYDLYPVEGSSAPHFVPGTAGLGPKVSPTRSKGHTRTPTDHLVDNEALW